MRYFPFLLAALSLFVATGCASSQDSEETPAPEPVDLGRYFEEADIEGTFVLYDLQENDTLSHNRERAEQAFVPASTFKIPNSLIALETGVIPDTSTVLEWDGQEREFDVWNRDHSMTTAFRNSVVWYYQEVARRVGEERMQNFISRMHYGNENIGGGIDQFWLTGDLRITPLDQIDFLVRLYNNDLPFSPETLEKVKGIMVEEETDNGVLRAKTGWEGSVGWYVGYVEHEGQPYFFALNADIDSLEQAAERRRITKAILSDRGLL